MVAGGGDAGWLEQLQISATKPTAGIVHHTSQQVDGQVAASLCDAAPRPVQAISWPGLCITPVSKWMGR